jgi:hypothetical protein
MTPPLGSIIVGPCPRCEEMVLLFDGSIMPLDKNIILDGAPEEKKQHLLEAIVDMAAIRVEELIESGELAAGSKPRKKAEPIEPATEGISPSVLNEKAPYISREEVKDFVSIDLHLIDSKSHFDKIFATGSKGSRSSRGKRK